VAQLNLKQLPTQWCCCNQCFNDQTIVSTLRISESYIFKAVDFLCYCCVWTRLMSCDQKTVLLQVLKCYSVHYSRRRDAAVMRSSASVCLSARQNQNGQACHRDSPRYPFNIRSKGQRSQSEIHISDDWLAGVNLHSTECPSSSVLTAPSTVRRLPKITHSARTKRKYF